MNTNPIPFLDLVTPHVTLEKELTEVFTSVLRKASFIGGSYVENLEKEFAAFCDTKYAVALNSGTDAVRFALMAAGIKQGDTVVTVPNTFIATTEAISQAGAHIDFVDVDENTSSMSPQKLAEYFTQKCDFKNGVLVSKKTNSPVTALVPVHLYGQCADMDPIMELAAKYNLKVIEDACQAHGAQYFSKRQNKWLAAGSIGIAAAFSFYPGKNLGAMGEGGAVTTNDESIAKYVKMLRDHGQAKKYFHDIEGYNGRLDSMQCGFLSVKLKHLPAWNEQRRAHAAYYAKLLKEIPLVKYPVEPSWSKAVFHLYVIHVKNRDQLQQHLNDQKIATGLHYPLPLHLQNAYKHLGYKKGDFPVTEKLADELLSLPMFPELTDGQQKVILDEIKKR